MSSIPQTLRFSFCVFAIAIVGFAIVGCGGSKNSVTAPTQPTMPTYVVPTMAPTFSLTGDITPVHDPSLSYSAGTYYSLTTDPGGTNANFLQIRTSTDKLAWEAGGAIFPTMPPFINAYFAPTVLTSLWAPDLSYFNGLWHLYYTASEFGTNMSLIGLATSPTLDPTAAGYGWTSQGTVISSNSQNVFNTIDPTILVDTDSSGNLTHVWLTYGSYFGGIYQREIDPATGMPLASNTANVQLATRPGVAGNPIEGTSMVKHNGYYYLFASFDACCNTNPATDNYKIAVGRSMSPQGPFLDMNGTSMLQGGGTILLESGTNWIAPGGATVITDVTAGTLIAYHALSVTANYQDFLFVNTLTWPNDWPVISQ